MTRKDIDAIFLNAGFTRRQLRRTQRLASMSEAEFVAVLKASKDELPEVLDDLAERRSAMSVPTAIAS